MSNGINAPYGLIAVESVSGDGATRKMKEYKIKVDADGSTGVGVLYYGDPVKFEAGGLFGSFPGANIVAGIDFNPGEEEEGGAPGTYIRGAMLGTFIGCRYTAYGDTRVTESKNWPGGVRVKIGSEVIFYVNDDPNTIFKVQMSTSDNNAKSDYGQSPCVFQDWMVGMNAMLQVGGTPFNPKKPIISPDIIGIPEARNNPVITGATKSIVYLDGSSINLQNGGKIPDWIKNDDENAADFGMTASGNPGYDVKIIGLAPSSSREFAAATAPAPYNNAIPGVNMPFCDLLVKFNRHVYGSPGVAGLYNDAEKKDAD